MQRAAFRHLDVVELVDAAACLRDVSCPEVDPSGDLWKRLELEKVLAGGLLVELDCSWRS